MILIKQYKTLSIPIKCSKSDLDYLYQCNRLSAQVWNLCVEIAENYRKENEGKWIDRNTLQRLTKKCVPLHAKGIQHVLGKYLAARDAILQARKSNNTTGALKFPYRQKKYFVTGWDTQSIKVDYEKGLIMLSKPEYLDGDGKKCRQAPIFCYAKSIPQNIVQVELVYKDKLYLSIKYIENVESLQIKSNNHASIDLGEIHSITSIDSSGNAIIITGRLIRSIKQLRNKQQANIYRRMSKCKKGSRQYRKYMRALYNLKVKFDQKILDCVHKITKLYVDYCIQNNVSVVYYGDLDSATRKTKQRKRGNRMVRQKLSQWNFGQIVKYLENKMTHYGVKLIKVSEAYSSQKCPCCNKLNKPKGREYKCRRCNYHQHRDIVGAINILNDNDESKLNEYESKKYLQIV